MRIGDEFIAFKKPGADIPGKRDDLDYDVGNLEATDNHQVDMEVGSLEVVFLIFWEFNANKEDYLLKVTRDNTQFLINHLFELPTENTDVGPVVCVYPLFLLSRPLFQRV